MSAIGQRSFATSAARSASSTGSYCLELNEEQRGIQDLARKFTREEIVPKAAHYDKANGKLGIRYFICIDNIRTQFAEYPWDVVKKAHEVGLMNPHIPQDLGGLGLGCFDACLVTEEMAWGCTGITLAIEGTTLGVSYYSYLSVIMIFDNLIFILFNFSKLHSF